jgi:hypothetical protein
MDALLAHLFGVPVEVMHDWINPGRYVSGRELAAAGMAELMDLDELHRVSWDRMRSESKPTATNGNGAGSQSRRLVKAPARRRRRRR